MWPFVFLTLNRLQSGQRGFTDILQVGLSLIIMLGNPHLHLQLTSTHGHVILSSGPEMNILNSKQFYLHVN